MALIPVLGPLLLLLALNLTRWLVLRHVRQQHARQRAQLLADVGLLRREAAKLNNPDTYAKCAKYQRLANAKDKELSALGSTPDTSQRQSPAGRALLLANTGKTLLLLIATFILWGAPVSQLPPSVAFPANYVLGFPRLREYGAFGLIAAAPWLWVCDKATLAVAQAVFPVQPPGPVVATLPADPKKEG